MFVVLGQQHEHTTTAGNPQVERADFGPCRFDDRSRFKCQMIFARMAGTARSVFITASVEPVFGMRSTRLNGSRRWRTPNEQHGIPTGYNCAVAA